MSLLTEAQEANIAASIRSIADVLDPAAEPTPTPAPSPTPNPTPLPGNEHPGFELIFSENFDTECAERQFLKRLREEVGRVPKGLEGQEQKGHIQPRRGTGLLHE